MKKYVVEFLKRGLMFAGFGPVVAGVVFLIISLTANISFCGSEIFLAIIFTYFLAFIQAGASVFNQVEGWSIPKSLGFHFGTLYLAYLSCYLLNTWIPFDWIIVLIFTLIFLVTYFVIWLIVYLIVKQTTKKLNEKL